MKLSLDRIRFVARKMAHDLAARGVVKGGGGEDSLTRSITTAMRDRVHIDEELDGEARVAMKKRWHGPSENTPEYMRELAKVKVELAAKRKK